MFSKCLYEGYEKDLDKLLNAKYIYTKTIRLFALDFYSIILFPSNLTFSGNKILHIPSRPVVLSVIGHFQLCA